MNFTFTTAAQGFVLADSTEWVNPTRRDGGLPIVNRDGRWIANIGPTELDVTNIIHNQKELSEALVKLVSEASSVSEDQLRTVGKKEKELAEQLRIVRADREVLVKLAARSSQNPTGMTIRQISVHSGVSYQRISQLIND